jgi:hypothetical protein
MQNMQTATTNPYHSLSLDDLPPKLRGRVCASLACAGLELVNILPDEPAYKEKAMKKVMRTLARVFIKAETCPLQGITLQKRQEEIVAAYEYQPSRRAYDLLSRQASVRPVK